jgi:hypothetical protein
MTIQQSGQGSMGGGSSSSSLADVVETVLDKGVVIDAQVNVGVIGIQLINIDARIVIASVDTYLRFAEAVNRLSLPQQQSGLKDMVDGGAKGKVLGKAAEVLDDIGTRGQDRQGRAK